MLKLQLIIFPLLVRANDGVASVAGRSVSAVADRPKWTVKSLSLDFEALLAEHQTFVDDVCPISFNVTGNCNIGAIPHGLALSGGACLAILMQAGLFRSGALNPFVEYYIYGGVVNEPLFVSSSSGGGLWYTRFLVLRDYPIPNKYAYPCSLMDVRFRDICYGQSDFGQLGTICDSEHWNVLQHHVQATYADCIAATGGGGAMFSAFTLVYYNFLNTVPASQGEKQYVGYLWTRYLKYNGFWGVPQTWSIGVDLVAPKLATPRSPYNYAYNAHLPEGYYSAATVYDDGGVLAGYTVGQDWAWNISTAMAIGQSGAIGAATQLLPFSIGPNNYRSTDRVDSSLKVQALTLSFVMANRLMAKQNIPSSTYHPGCQAGCPVFDTAAIDNVPLTTQLAAISKVPMTMWPGSITAEGPAATFELWSHLMGEGPMNIYLGGGSGANFCPFPELTICTSLTQIRIMLKNLANDDVLHAYTQTSEAYQIWLPENQIITTLCGDPIAYDQFRASCEADSFCSMPLVAVPSSKMQISFTMTPIKFIISNVYLGNTGLAADFVETYLPLSIRKIPNMRDMDKWFPAFTVMGGEKGGFGFYRPLGHAFMDYCTIVLVRKGKAILTAKTTAEYLFKGTVSEYSICDYAVYKDIADLNVPNFGAFREKLNGNAFTTMKDGTLGGVVSQAWVDKAIEPKGNLDGFKVPAGFTPVGTK